MLLFLFFLYFANVKYFNWMTISILHSAVHMVPVKREVSCGPNVMSQYLMMEETGILVENALSQIDIY